MSEAMEQPNWALNSRVEHFVANAEYGKLEAYLEEVANKSLIPEEITAALLKLGEVRLEMMDDTDAAVEAYQRLLEVDADNADAILALEMAYAAAERWVDLVEVLERKIACTLDLETKLNALEQCAAIYEDVLGDPTRALECFRDMLVIDPEDVMTVGGVTRLEAQLS